MTYTIHAYPVRLIDIVQLADGARVTIRPVLPQDIGLHCAFVRELSPAARRFRFMTGMSEMPEAMARQLTSVDYTSHLALVATVFRNDEEMMIAEARYAADGAGVAEFAIAIKDDWQRLGLGRTLLLGLERHAARSGLQRITGGALIGNEPMLRLVRACGYTVRPDPDDVDRAIFVKHLACHAAPGRTIRASANL